MRKLILAMQVSLDGYVEGSNKDMSWMLQPDDEQWQDLFKMLHPVDLVLLGAGMWEDYRNYWKGVLTKSDPDRNELAYARYAEDTQHLVFSNTIKQTGWHNTMVLSGSLAHEVRKLKQMAGKDIQVFGGAQLAASLINAGLFDEYHFMINPVFVGGGKSLFHDLQIRLDLETVSTKRYRSGVERLVYRSRSVIRESSIS